MISPAAVAQTIHKVSSHNNGFSPIKLIQRIPCTFAPFTPNTTPNQILIRDIRKVKHKLRAMKRNGPRNFEIVSDFDQTMTKLFHENKRIQSSFEYIVKSIINPELTNKIEEANVLHRQQNRALDKEDWLGRYDNIEKWSNECRDIILSEKINIRNLERDPKEAFIIPRDSFGSFLNVCSNVQVPFYMISAGISNMIASILDCYLDVNKYSKLNLYSNEMVFNEDGDHVDFRKPHVHSYSKNNILRGKTYSQKSILLLGDMFRDLHLTQNIRPAEQLTIGYPNYAVVAEHAKATETYLRKFDIVIPIEGSLELPELITRYMFDLESERTLFSYLEDHVRSFSDMKDSIENGSWNKRLQLQLQEQDEDEE